jgi:putative Holliday junction resolvase
MRTGRRVAFDVGKARIGVAVSDAHGILASPRDFISRDSDLDISVTALCKIVGAEEAIEIYVGLPLNLRNEFTESTQDAVLVARAVASAATVSVRLIDERMSTKLASGAMSASGKNTRSQRGSIDSASAAVILETALQLERSTGVAPGTAIEDFVNGE